jgi:hypothetical protein
MEDIEEISKIFDGLKKKNPNISDDALSAMTLSVFKYRQDQRKFDNGGKAPSMKQMYKWLRARDEVEESVRVEADKWIYNQPVWTSDIVSNALKMLGHP